MKLTTLTPVAILLAASSIALASEPACPMHAQHQAQAGQHGAGHDHLAGLSERGAHHMGFDQHATTHHFRLSPTGGAIEVTANDAADASGTAQVRAHLQEIAKLFAAGDFSKPRAIHDQVPPGVETMTARQAEIRWRYEELPTGGRVRIETTTPETLAAVYAFLRFQIEDHQTGDSLQVAAP